FEATRSTWEPYSLEINDARQAVYEAVFSGRPGPPVNYGTWLEPHPVNASETAVPITVALCAVHAAYADAKSRDRKTAYAARDAQSTWQAAIFRDLFGIPFRPLPPRPFPSHVIGLAEACYAAFPEVSDQFLILADALAELVEETAATHCRKPLHAKGCHVVD